MINSIKQASIIQHKTLHARMQQILWTTATIHVYNVPSYNYINTTFGLVSRDELTSISSLLKLAQFLSISLASTVLDCRHSCI